MDPHEGKRKAEKEEEENCALYWYRLGFFLLFKQVFCVVWVESFLRAALVFQDFSKRNFCQFYAVLANDEG